MIMKRLKIGEAMKIAFNDMKKEGCFGSYDKTTFRRIVGFNRLFTKETRKLNYDLNINSTYGINKYYEKKKIT